MRTVRSMLRSMQRLLERTRHGLALGALTAALGLLGGATTGSLACGLYGPPSYDDQDTPLYGVPTADVVPDEVADANPDVGPAESTPLYGIQPTDALQDAQVPDVAPDCGQATLYGPPPCSSDADCQGYGDTWYCDKADPCASTCKPK